MHIGVCRLVIRIPDADNLKGKRQVSRSLADRIRNRFNVAIAEVGDYNLRQRLTLGVSCVSNESAHANEIISKVVSFIETSRRDVELIDYEIELISGV